MSSAVVLKLHKSSDRGFLQNAKRKIMKCRAPNDTEV